jgi:nicotinamide-nucleotide amidase
MKIHLVTIGDEILIGQIIDTNSAWMAQQLNLIGASIIGITSISDEKEQIKEVLQRTLQEADAVLLTGGLGPTRDDMTKQALADFLGVELFLHEPTYERILRFFEKLGRPVTEAHRLQSFMPEGVQIMHNKMGTAPGMWFQHNDKVIVSMPGVPYEMKYLMENEVIPALVKAFPSLPVAHRTLLTAGEGESRIAERIRSIEDELPAHIKLAYLPNLGQVRLRLSGKYPDKKQLDESLDHYAEKIRSTIPELIFGVENDRLQAAIGRMLKEKGMTISTAESCTGGYLAHLITSVAGASEYFTGSIIAYDNKVKMEQLGVKADTLAEHGAVSEQTVREMAAGSVHLLGTDIAVAISGIAGPGGGTPEKPVGTIWIAVGNNENMKTQLLHAGKDRQKNIEYTASRALNFIRQYLISLT